jgi:hypothetical protein
VEELKQRRGVEVARLESTRFLAVSPKPVIISQIQSAIAALDVEITAAESALKQTGEVTYV